MSPVPKSLNPLELIARRWQPSAALVRRAALATVVMAVIIVVTGGAVRLSQSGLGCSTWPKCTPDSLTPTAAMGINGLIEFSNRMLTYVLCAVVGVFIIAARARHPRRRSLTRLGWAQFWLVMSNAVVGGVTVLTGLNPYIVSSHFLAATALLTVAVLSWKRACEGDDTPRDVVARPVRQLAWLLVGATAALTVIGTVVTGAGPHAGDARKVHRIPLDWQEITQLHVDFVYIVVGLSVALWFTLRAVKAPAAPRRLVLELFACLALQGVIGYVQYFMGLPEIVIGFHMLGSSLVWIWVLRVCLSLRDRGPLPEGDPDESAPSSAAQEAPEPQPASALSR
ncbi:cytochrome c oxidase assembly protein subunit 15 [Streptomyces sp. 2224.1]|nr:cytochrome c oxidase assembly protein subunit 15 [Streptomyces sp. 2321.6]SDR53293.1 cytochrome c oxidase assembly protein subunit 15 [Streptomyces sp. KS_16]SEC29069.1 cytochrome c oxidase assembly protein subunit 15 [Streptomyces sp. 2133.1]SED06038.1 cytochrome c oxidase assembly protein subunit 15 [Streptomyces sp. 2224.1]SNC66398.1 cytochrome c oxidase assembly protein subunit 15 [Streptomyces sp. 2114.4]